MIHNPTRPKKKGVLFSCLPIKMRIKSSMQNIIILLIKMNEYAEHERAAAVVAVEERASLAEGTHHRYSSSSFNVFSINNLIWNAILIFHPAKDPP